MSCEGYSVGVCANGCFVGWADNQCQICGAPLTRTWFCDQTNGDPEEEVEALKNETAAKKFRLEYLRKNPAAREYQIGLVERERKNYLESVSPETVSKMMAHFDKQVKALENMGKETQS